MKIVIVGGGSSGWIAATTLLAVPNCKITVIESPNIPKIGVGESTVDGFINWMNLMGINPEDMMKDTDATYKLAIRFEDFLKKNHEFFYPFGAFGIDKTHYHTWAKRRFIDPDSNPPFADSFFPNMALVRANKFKKDSYSFPHNCHALHFDAAKFGPWLWENYCKPRGVNRIDLEVKSVEVGENGVEWLELIDGHKITGDLYIDCTGFKSMLLEGALGVPFLDYSNVIPNNIAWATHMPYLDKEKELVGYTNCTAMENGWVWNIPLWSRIGAGYVYSDKFVTDEAALEEFKSHIRKTGRDPETLEYKKIVMRNGIHEKIWHKNVVGIGLAAGFIEPLESTGLWFTHEFAYTLLRILFRGAHPKQHDRDMFNTMIKFQWDEMVKFICQHYAFSARTDTEYWRNIAKLDFPIDKNLCIASIEQMDRYYTGWPGIHAILAGLEYHVYDETYFWQRVYPKTQDWKKIYKKEFSELDRGIKSWTEEASRAPSLLHVLSKIHDNKLSE